MEVWLLNHIKSGAQCSAVRFPNSGAYAAILTISPFLSSPVIYAASASAASSLLDLAAYSPKNTSIPPPNFVSVIDWVSLL